MIVKILGVIDIIGALFFAMFFYFNIFSSVALLFAFVFLVKGIFFISISALTSIASWVDLVFAIVIFIALEHPVPRVIAGLLIVFEIAKGVLSLM